MSKRKRGSYKKYLTDDSEEIPVTTKYSRLLSAKKGKIGKQMDQECDHEQNDVIIQEHSFQESFEKENLNHHYSGLNNENNKSKEDENEQDYQSENESENNDCFDNKNDNNEMYYFDDNGELYEDDNSSDSEESENHDEYQEYSQEPTRLSIYEGCDLSKEESQLMIMSMAIQNKLTDSALQALLQIIDSHLPYRVYSSKYHFLQFFPKVVFCKYYFCPTCFIILTFHCDTITECNNCRKRYEQNQLQRNFNYFYHFSLKSQLIELLKTKLFTQFRKNSLIESDIVDGKLYRKLKEQKVICDNDITIQWNTDGVEIFNSSTYTIWPIQVCINELPYRVRRDNILLCGLWFYNHKPPMDLFLRPFIDELLELETNGFWCVPYKHKEPILVKVYTLLVAVDTIARPLIQNMKQFNGAYGCSYCFHKGEQTLIGRGQTRIYSGNKSMLRNIKQHYKHIERANNEGRPVKGVKGPSVVMLLSTCHIIHSFPPEYMHSVLLGVTKLFGSQTLWFDSVNNNKDWYLGLKVTEFNNKLLAIRPPCEITRTPQSVKNTK
ncbi:variant-silencing SET domain-containing protein-like [Monomorium pharaonis]|uniref:variant-silencing SET domain-containing protein-like n=1 Tax=Monomorium pharaonis TaxID=307658 RepID=UPI001746979E|nr:variant-silencing SET domain-containing protein-like [Monomorium pharaonis]